MDIKNMIYEIRGQYVMLDYDLAKLYECKNGTKSINLAVKRHIDRFPERFMFQLNEIEVNNLRFQVETANYNLQSNIILRSQIGTANKVNISKTRTLPYAFTEQGVAMLATILRTEVAVKVSIEIMNAFVHMKKYISANLIEQKYINNQVMKNTEDIKLLQDSFSKFEEKKIVNEIYFKGQIYDAYSKIIDILNEANKEIIIIDSFLDKSILDMVRNINVKVILITSNKSKLKETDIKKYQLQYTNLDIKYGDTFHDRYIIIDKNTTYHLGASINHAGSKTFSINILEDKVVKDALFNNIGMVK